jgi:septal ring factor EnvC (AmiA/AmiB activator)
VARKKLKLYEQQHQQQQQQQQQQQEQQEQQQQEEREEQEQQQQEEQEEQLLKELEEANARAEEVQVALDAMEALRRNHSMEKHGGEVGRAGARELPTVPVGEAFPRCACVLLETPFHE